MIRPLACVATGLPRREELFIAQARSLFQEHIPDIANKDEGGSTIVVVSLVIEIEGDTTLYVRKYYR